MHCLLLIFDQREEEVRKTEAETAVLAMHFPSSYHNPLLGSQDVSHYVPIFSLNSSHRYLQFFDYDLEKLESLNLLQLQLLRQ